MGLTLLVLGVLLWWAAHLFKRLAPGPRAALSDRMGDASRGLFAGLLVMAIVLMVIGYRQAQPGDWLWFPQGWMYHLNNGLILIGFYIFGIGMARGVLSQKIRHPMLIGTLIWAVAHLMLRSHLPGVVLFGGIALWTVVAMVLINLQDGAWKPKPAKGGWERDLIAGVVVVVVYVLVGALHGILGPDPFGGI